MIKNLKYLIRYIAILIMAISIILFVYLLNNYRSLFNTLNTNYDAGKIPISETWKEQTNSENSFVWVGHATILLNLDGENILIDPIFSERASPFSFIGPRRLISPAIPINELPKISKVLISHNHYDHLDIPTLIELQNRNTDILFFVPKGDKTLLQRSNLLNIKEFEWWESTTINNKVFTFFPVKHWSARTFFDRNNSLWGGWKIQSLDYTVAHFGDTGYDSLFSMEREKFGNIDVAFIPIGSYAPREIEKDHHVNPEEAIKIAEDLNIDYSFGIHWGTFFLSKEPLFEPPELIRKYQSLNKEKVFSTSKPGQLILLDSLQYQTILDN